MRRISNRTNRALTAVFIALLILSLGAQPALAQSGDESDSSDGGDGDSALGDVIIDALEGLLYSLFHPIETIKDYGEALAGLIIGTPHPDAVFSKPTNGPWPNIYTFYWKTIIPLSLSLYGLSLGLVIFLESTSHLFSGYHRSKLKKRAFAGLLGILSWWWIAALSLRFVDALAGFLAPDLSSISLFQTLSFSTIGLLGLVISWAADLILFLLIGLTYIIRQQILYLFVLMMPLLIIFWIPGLGPFSLVSKFMKKLAGFYVPFLFMTVPVALLFRLGHLLGTSADLSLGGVGAWLSAIAIPFLALVLPLVLFWQAGLLFFIGDRIAHHVSAERAKRRASRVKGGAETGRHGGQNLIRGLRDEPAVTRSDQMVLNSGGSRAHAAGKRLNSAGSRLRHTFRGDGGGSSGGGRSGGGGGGGGTSSGDSGGGGSDSTSGGSSSDTSGSSDQNTSHDNTRDPPQRSQDSESSDQDRPPYIY